jgi:hypothetical protein
MQAAVLSQTKPKRHSRGEIKQSQEDLLLKEYASTITRIIVKKTFASVQSLKVDLEPNRVILTGFCDSYYTKQLAQQAVMDIVIDMEIVNDIVVI